MTDAELREIEAHEKAATPGPWMTEKPDDDALDARPAVVGEKRRTRVGTERPIIVNDAWAPDAVFIAAARSDVPALCAEVRRLVVVVRTLASVAEECAQDADMHDVEDNIKRQLTPIHAAVADARAAIEGYEVDE